MRTTMLFGSRAAALGLASLLIVVLCATAAAAERQLVDGIAAVVGDQVILESEVDEELYIYQARSGASGLTEEEALGLRSDILQQMIEEMLLVASASRDSIKLAPGRLESELDRRVEDLKTRHGSEEAFNAALEAEGLTLDELKDIYRDDIRRRLIAEEVVKAKVHSRVAVTWGEVEQYYNEHAEEVAEVPEAYELGGILISAAVSEQAKREALERLGEARERLDAGESFEDLAREYSDDASAPRGGDVGFIEPGMTVPEFEEAVYALSPGEVSGVVTTRFGFHLIQLVEKDGDRAHVRHILARLAPGPDDYERARAKAESLRSAYMDGADFAELAYQYSDDQVSRENGGTLGWFTAEDLDDAFMEVLGALDDGNDAEVVDGESGYYVLRLISHEPARTATLEEVRNDLREYIYGLKVEQGYRELLDRLSEEVFIDIRTQMVREE